MDARQTIKGVPVTLVVIALAVLVLFVVGKQAGLFSAGSNRINGQEARALVERGALLVDVRTPAEFAEGHIKGAVNIPVDQIAQRASELGATDREVVLYCRSGARSSLALRKLSGLGFSKVHDLGPKTAW